MTRRLCALLVSFALAGCVAAPGGASDPAPGTGGSPAASGGASGTGGSVAPARPGDGDGPKPSGSGGGTGGGASAGTGGSGASGGASGGGSDAASPGEGSPGGTGDGGAEVAVPAAGGGGCPAGRNLIWQLDLNDPRWNQGATGVTAIVTGTGGRIVSGAKNASVIPDADHKLALKIVYPPGSGSLACAEDKSCSGEGGLAFRMPLPNGKSITSAVLSYWVKFETGFDWVKGGKLHGLCGNLCPTGGRAVESDRFSIRYMWRGGGTGMVYSYLTSPPNDGYGLDIGVGKWRWQNDGKWHQIHEELILNTGNNADGIIRVWYDKAPSEAPSFEQKNLKYYDRVKYPDLGIDTFIFSTFHGGNDRSWAPNKEETSYFADFRVCK